MGLPKPEVGLVISYSYLWAEEAALGRVEGRKDRPCAIVLSVQQGQDKHSRVAVAPITHSPPREPEVAIEIPRAVKRHLGLDTEKSWIILSDFNVFTWPGYDLRPIASRGSRFDYGLLPPNFFKKIVEKFTELRRANKISHASRDA